jgi:hypothetical protein
MRRELKSSVSIAASLVLGFLLLFPQFTVQTVSAGTAPSSLTPTVSSPDDQAAIARVIVNNNNELQLLMTSDVNLLKGPTDEAVYVQATVAKLEELKQQGWPVKLLYVRGLDNSTWQSVEAPSGDCMYSITPTEESFTASGGVFSFDLTTDADCEWTVITDFPTWIQINHVGQGTGSDTIPFSIAANSANTNRIGHIFIGGQIFTIYQGARYNDVPVGHPFYLEIGKLSARGVTVGCGNGNFCPNDLVPREQMAAFILRAKGEFNPPTPAMQRFADVPPSNFFYNFIDRIAELGITQGCSAVNYCPGDALLREQAAVFIIRGIGEFSPPTPATQRYVDVPPSHPFYNFIDRLAALGITQGCSSAPPMFCPKGTMTRATMAVFLVRAFDL